MKAFILFLTFATLAIMVGLLPVYSLAWRQIHLVTGLTWGEEWMYTEWWNVKWTWIGGPMTRYLGAVVVSYLFYDPDSVSRLEGNPAGEAPISMTLLFFIFYGTILGFFCIVMSVSALSDVIKASSTIEATRTSRRGKAGVKHLHFYRHIQMPIVTGEDMSAGKGNSVEVQEIPAKIKLYDFGLIENLKRTFGSTPREWACK